MVGSSFYNFIPSVAAISRCLGLFSIVMIILQPSNSLAVPEIPMVASLERDFLLPRGPSTTTLNSKPSGVSDDDDAFPSPPLLQSPDYLVTDSSELDDADRPSLSDFVRCYPRELYLRAPLLLSGTVLALCNVFGFFYDDNNVYDTVVRSCVALGVLNAVADARTSRGISPNVRRGAVDNRVLQVYGVTYTLSVSWLACRVYVCPAWLPAYDPVLAWVAVTVFAGSLLSPLVSLWSDDDTDNAWLQATQLALVRIVRGDATIATLPPFTPTERYRAGGLVAVGLVAALYLPESLYLARYGASWWNEDLLRQWPQQGLLEADTALFGLVAAQANIAITSAAGFGVAPMGKLVPLGAATAFLLALVPCACALYWLQQGDYSITFFEHYQYVPSLAV